MANTKHKQSKTPSSRELLEVVDRDNRVVGLMPRDAIHNQHLLHRRVLVLLYDCENKLYLKKRSAKKISYPGCWDLSATGHVLATESPDEAAIRKLKEELGIAVSRVTQVFALQASAETEYEFVSLFTAGVNHQVPQPNPQEMLRGLFLENHELDYLVRSYPSHLTPGLLHFWNLGLLFQ